MIVKRDRDPLSVADTDNGHGEAGKEAVKTMDTSSEEERRKYERLPFREDIMIDGVQCSSMDISEGGLYLSAIQLFEEGSVVEANIPFKGDKITVKAQVRYSHPGIGMGIMFVDLNDRQRAMIKELIECIASH